MGRLKTFLDRLAPQFSQGGRYQKYGALFEMVETLLYTPKDVTRGPPTSGMRSISSGSCFSL